MNSLPLRRRLAIAQSLAAIVRDFVVVAWAVFLVTNALLMEPAPPVSPTVAPVLGPVDAPKVPKRADLDTQRSSTDQFFAYLDGDSEGSKPECNALRLAAVLRAKAADLGSAALWGAVA